MRLPLRHEVGERAGGEVVLRVQGAKPVYWKFILDVSLEPVINFCEIEIEA